MSQAAEEITAQLKEHPVIVQHIGEISGVEQQLTKGPQHLTTAQIEKGWWLWSIEGSKGSGLLKVHMVADEAAGTAFNIDDGELLMGEDSYPLFKKKVPPAKVEPPAKEEDGPGKPETPTEPEKPAESLPDPK